MKKTVRKTAAGRKAAAGQSLSVVITPDVVETLERASEISGTPVEFIVNEGARSMAASIASDRSVMADMRMAWLEEKGGGAR
jgi:hypothetical protein